MLVLLAGVAAIALFGGHMLQCMVGAVTERLGGLGAPDLISIEGVVRVAHESAGAAGKAVMPIMILVGVTGLLASIMQTGVLITPKKLVPDLGHIDPIRGLKNLFSLSALMRLVLAVAKVAVIGLLAFFLLRGKVHWLYSLVGKSAWGVLAASRQLYLSLMVRIVAAMMVVALLDYAYQRWRYEKQLMMTKAELREEHKRDEGAPEIRARQAQMRRAMARSRMIQAVPEADVVVTNPTRIAVALRWQESEMDAPQVVAKGKDYLAERIKQVAREHSVPVLERKILAGALYEAVEVGVEIPAKLYAAVAEVLAFVMKKGNRL